MHIRYNLSDYIPVQPVPTSSAAPPKAKAGSAIVKLGDYERPAPVAEILERNLRGWPRPLGSAD